ncbi:MAG: response regulator [Pararhodobacter sp.]|nr:response regulator [Pararhodobacter sp.]
MTSNSGSAHILIAEDDELVGELLSAQLKSLGYRVTFARTGSEALERLERLQDIDMLATDIVMPGGMTGRELAKAAIRLRPNLKVLFVSGYAKDSIIREGRLEPDVEFLKKPYRLRELATTVRKVLDSG